MNLNEASVRAYEIAVKRNQYKGDGKDTIRALKYCAGEVVEATEAYTKLQSTPSPNQAKIYIHDTGLELAEIGRAHV